MNQIDDTASSVQGSLADTAKDILQNAHRAAKAKAMPLLPKDDVTRIIATIVDVLEKKRSPEDALKEAAETHTEAAKAYATVFACEALRLTLQKADTTAVRALADGDFPQRMIVCSASLVNAVQKYHSHTISKAEFINQIGGTDLSKLGMEFLGAAGKDGVSLRIEPERLAGICAPIVGFAASAAAYELLRQSLEDAALAREERLYIENQCARSVAMIRRFRAEMNEVVSQYLTAHIETFEAGFSAMDKALLEGDIHGYLKGNAEIQSILGYKAQFTSQQEFDDLMDSDTAFTL